MCCVGKVRFPLLLFGSLVFWVSHARFSSTFLSKSCAKTWYHLYISDPLCCLQKFLNALFNLVWNTQKNKWTIFLVSRQSISYYWNGFRKGKWRPTLNALPYRFSPHVWDKGATFLFSYNLTNIAKQNWL